MGIRKATRREFLAFGAAAAGAASSLGGGSLFGAGGLGAQESEEWKRGLLAHLLPMVNHERMRLKASFTERQLQPPVLKVDGLEVAGRQTDSAGRFFQFDVSGLTPTTPYELQIVDPGGEPLCDPWLLRTFPAPDAEPERLRVLIYTCAGGSEASNLGDRRTFNSVAVRQRLLDRALAFRPNVVIGVGDHIYWDQLSAVLRRRQDPERMLEYERMLDTYGRFDRSEPVIGSDNEYVFRKIADEQIAQLYGVRLRSFPTFLTQDDHDYFENDEATDELVTFPPDPFMLHLARAGHRLYYPEFLSDPTRPGGLEAGVCDQTVSEAYGTLRYGRLVEMLLYDCRRYLTLTGPSAGFVSDQAERWIRTRMAADETRHLINVPSTPVGWTAGKWAEWYPDLLEVDGGVGIRRDKLYWQSGWFQQHQRLLESASWMRRIPLFVSGDLHAVGAASIHRSLDLDLKANPVQTLLAGPVSSDDLAFPSAFRGTGAVRPAYLGTEESFSPVEKNGFTLLDITPDAISVRQFAVRLQAGTDVARLQPAHELELRR